MILLKHRHPRIFSGADVQLQAFSQFSGTDEAGYCIRAKRLMETLDQIIVAAHEQSPLDAIVWPGDFLDNRSAIPLPIIELGSRYARKWAALTTVIFVVGNHEQYKKAHSDITSLSMFEPHCIVVRSATVIDIAGQPVAFSPFESDLTKIYEGLDMLAASGAKLLFGHWTVAGCTTGNEVLEKGVRRDYPAFDKFDAILLGDIHQTQVLRDNMLYLGSPQQHDHGEKGDKFVWILDGTELTPVETCLPKFHRVASLTEAKSLKDDGHFVELHAATKAEAEAGVELGVPVERVYTETVATYDRPALNGYADAVRWWAETNLEPDAVERQVALGLTFFEGLKNTSFPVSDLRIGKVRGKNFMSYGTIEYDLSKTGPFVLLNGEVDCGQQCDSNGAGKTTVFELPYAVIYGRTLKFGNQLAKAIRVGEKEMEGEVFVFNDSSEVVHRIVRTVPGGLKLFRYDYSTYWMMSQTELDDPSYDISLGGIPATQARIVELFGEPELFLMSTLLALHATPSFLKLDESAKKEFFDRASGLAVFDDALEAVKVKVKATEQSREALRVLTQVSEAKINSAEETVASAARRISDEEARIVRVTEQNIAKADAILAEVAASRANRPTPPTPADKTGYEGDVVKKLKRVETLTTLLAALTDDLEASTIELAGAKVEVDTRQTEYDASAKAVQEAQQSWADFQGQSRATEATYSKRARAIESEMSSAPKAGDVCRSCGYTYTGEEDSAVRVKHLKEDLSKVNAEWDAWKKETAQVESDGKEYLSILREKEKADLAELTSSKTKHQQISTGHRSVERAKAEAESDLRLAKSELASAQRALADLDKENKARRAQYEDSMRVFDSMLEDRELEAEAVRTAPVSNNLDKLIADLASAKEKVEILRKESESSFAKLAELTNLTQDLEFWVKGFGSRGCKSLLYTGVLDAFNNHIREFSNRISGGMFSIRLLPYTENAKGVSTEKISVEMQNVAGSNQILGNSLGECTRVDIPVNLAVRALIRDKGLKWNLLFADEPWMGLDESGKKSIYGLLSSIRLSQGAVIVTDQSEFSKGNINAVQWTAKKTLVDGRVRSELILPQDASETPEGQET